MWMMVSRWPAGPVGVFNGKDIKTGPEMGRVRENKEEFGHCSGAKSVSMGALRPYFVGIRGRGIHYKMVGMFAQIKERDSVSGPRIGFLGVRSYQKVNGAGGVAAVGEVC